jgi:hypothetical protein
MIDQNTQSYLQSIIDATPSREGDLAAVIARGRRRRQTVLRGKAFGVMVAVVAAMGSAVFLSPGRHPIGGGDQLAELELPGGLVVEVHPDPVEKQGALVYVGRLGPAPTFDTTILGTEIALVRRPATDLIVPPAGDSQKKNALHASTLVYLGDLNGAQIALQVSDLGPLGLGSDILCVFWGNGTRITGGGDCEFSDSPASRVTADPPIGSLLLWTRLPANASVVILELPDGSRYWQRPTARTAFFNLPDGRSLHDTQLSVLDADGSVLTTGIPTDLQQAVPTTWTATPTTWIPAAVGPELVEVPVADMTVIMKPGLDSQEEIESRLSLVRGYVPGSGVHLASYSGPLGVDIYRFTSTDPTPGPALDGPAVCIAEAPVGQPVNGWTCTTSSELLPEYGILSTGNSASDGSDYSMAVVVGTRVETVVIETTTGYTIVIHPAGSIAYAAWSDHPPLRVTAFHDDGTTASEVVAP